MATQKMKNKIPARLYFSDGEMSDNNTYNYKDFAPSAKPCKKPIFYFCGKGGHNKQYTHIQ